MLVRFKKSVSVPHLVSQLSRLVFSIAFVHGLTTIVISEILCSLIHYAALLCSRVEFYDGDTADHQVRFVENVRRTAHVAR